MRHHRRDDVPRPSAPRRTTSAARATALFLVGAATALVATTAAVSWLAARWPIPHPGAVVAQTLAAVAVPGLLLHAILRRWEARVRGAADRERHAAERERDAAEQARQNSELQSSFLTAVSHELRTPLTSILGHATTLADLTGRRGHQDLHGLTQRLEANSRRLEALVLDLLDTDAMRHGIGRARVRPCEVAGLVRRATDPIDLDGRTLLLTGDEAIVQADVAKLERTVALLVDNAVRHSPADTLIAVQWCAEPDELLLVVDDDGPGLPDHLLPRLFDPFAQGRHAATVARPGMGLGLALVHQYVQLHGGRVVASTNPTGGARITIRLPQQPTATADTPGQQTVPAQRGERAAGPSR